MNDRKKERTELERQAAEERRKKAMYSLGICFLRSEVMRRHHDALLVAIAYDGTDEWQSSDITKARFISYVCYWFAGLAAVIERYQELANKGTIVRDSAIDSLLTPDKIDLIKPFRNAVSHCSPHDDARVLDFLAQPDVLPDWAAEAAAAFRRYVEPYMAQLEG